MRNLIGLGHYSRTGKDTIGRLIQERVGGESKCRIFSFAEKLKAVAFDVYKWAGMREGAYYNTPEGQEMRQVILPKLGLTPVDVWIKVGELFRVEIHPSTWVEQIMDEVESHLSGAGNWCVFTDVRFFTEVEATIKSDGILVKVEKPGVNPRPSTADRELLDFKEWDFLIDNNGDLSELAGVVDRLLTLLPEACGDNRLLRSRDIGMDGTLAA